MARRSSKWEPPEQKGPNWRAFGKILAIGHLRLLGLAPIPPVVLEQMKEAGLVDEMGRITAAAQKEGK